MKLRYTPRARLDLAEIHDHIARENPQAAKRVVTLIRQKTESLVLDPGIGRQGRIEGTRELIIDRHPFIVAYAIAGVNEIQILAVVHTSRLWAELF